MQSFFNIFTLAVNNPQGAQVKLGIAIENLKDEARPHEGVEVAQAVIAKEFKER